MDWRVFMTVFAMVFIAELGDKTQWALLNMSSVSASRVSIFLGGVMALVLSTGLVVLLGSLLAKVISPHLMRAIAGVVFVLIGLWLLMVKA